MDDDFDTNFDGMVVDVRADTAAFRAEIQSLRGLVDTTLVDGFARAGEVLERGLLGAIRKGSLGFGDLKRVALQTLGEVAAQALQSGLGNLLGGSAGAGSGIGAGGLLGGHLGGALNALLGLPGRATGGPVSPGVPYLVGERGPELFVPTAAGRVLPDLAAAAPARDVRVSITLAAPRGTAAPVALRRSARQMAAAVRRSL